MKCHVDAIFSGEGGGVVAEFFRGLQSRRDSVGGGSSRIFPWSPKADAIQWGGVVTGFFGEWGPFTFLGFPKGGGPAPWAPPLNRPLYPSTSLSPSFSPSSSRCRSPTPSLSPSSSLPLPPPLALRLPLALLLTFPLALHLLNSFSLSLSL